MTNKPLIGIDLDGVLADFSGRFISELRKQFGEPKIGVPQLGWDYKSMPGVTPQMEDTIFEKLRSTFNFWETLKPLPGCERLVGGLMEFEPIFITQRFPTTGWTAQEQSARWVANNFQIPYPTVIVVEDAKGPLVDALGCLTFIDDRIDNCLDVFDTAGCYTFLRANTYNQKLYGISDAAVKRVPTFDAMIEILEGQFVR